MAEEFYTLRYRMYRNKRDIETGKYYRECFDRFYNPPLNLEEAQTMLRKSSDYPLRIITVVPLSSVPALEE